MERGGQVKLNPKTWVEWYTLFAFYRPPYDIIHRVQTQAEPLQVLLLGVIEGPAASIHFVDKQRFKWRRFRHRGGHEANNVFAGKDL